MALIRCTNGHFYDSSKFSSCPYCVKKGAADNVTVPLGRSFPDPDVNMGREPEEKAIQPTPQRQQVSQEEPVVQPAPHPVQQMGSVSSQWRAPENPANMWNMPEDDNRTVSYYSRVIGSEPVVGWLVAIEGEYFGECFKLKSGRNFIGRSPEMDIQLSMDFSVSRKKHAVIIYEPKARIFIAQPGESRELFYLNDEVVLSNVTLKHSDILLIGETKLMFIPLCGKEFGWDDLKNKN